MDKSSLMQEIKAELDRDLAESEASAQELSQDLLAKLRDQNPHLMDLKVEAIPEIKISIVLGSSPLEGILLEYLQQEQSRIYKEVCSQIEAQIGRPVTLDEVEYLLTLPVSENNRLDGIWDNTKIVKEIQRGLLMRINETIPETQTIRPDILICIYLPGHRGAQIFIYAESKGKVLIDESLKPPTVTLDTNVVREWWECRDKVEHVNKLLELSKSFKIDLAVTGRIRDDIPRPPLADRINELPSLNVHETGSVIRFGCWKAGVDVAGNDEFKEFFGSPVIVRKLDQIKKSKRPDWRDWDHVHTHYRYGRNYFLTWDRGILHFADELQNRLDIIVMEPEQYLSGHQ